MTSTHTIGIFEHPQPHEAGQVLERHELLPDELVLLCVPDCQNDCLLIWNSDARWLDGQYECSQCMRNFNQVPTELSAGLMKVVTVHLVPSVDSQLERVAVVLEGNPVRTVDLMRTFDSNVVWCCDHHFWNRKINKYVTWVHAGLFKADGH